jgi:hypothetical protein
LLQKNTNFSFISSTSRRKIFEKVKTSDPVELLEIHRLHTKSKQIDGVYGNSTRQSFYPTTKFSFSSSSLSATPTPGPFARPAAHQSRSLTPRAKNFVETNENSLCGCVCVAEISWGRRRAATAQMCNFESIKLPGPWQTP